jgi:hypothetical protein
VAIDWAKEVWVAANNRTTLPSVSNCLAALDVIDEVMATSPFSVPE